MPFLGVAGSIDGLDQASKCKISSLNVRVELAVAVELTVRIGFQEKAIDPRTLAEMI